MYKTDSKTAAKILNSLRPSLIFVTVPFALDTLNNQWLNQFRTVGYSIIDCSSFVNFSKLHDLIKTRREHGNVLVHGNLTPKELDAAMPEEYAHVLWYANRQTEYSKLISERLTAKNRTGLPTQCDELWNKGAVNSITKKCHELQKASYEQHYKMNDRIFVVLCCTLDEPTNS